MIHRFKAFVLDTALDVLAWACGAFLFGIWLTQVLR